MIESFMLSAHIYPKTGETIKEHLKKWNKPHETDYCSSTNKYKDEGFLNIRVYDFINSSNRKICFLTLTINPRAIKAKNFLYNNFSYQMNTGALYEHITKDFLPVFKRCPKLLLRNIKFSLNLVGDDLEMYIKLLEKGFSLDSWNMKKKLYIDDSEMEPMMNKIENLDEMVHISEKYILHYKSPSASLNIAYHKGTSNIAIMDCKIKQPVNSKQTRIQLELIIHKYKIQNLMRKHKIENRKIYDFSKDNFLMHLEKELFFDYIGRISRKGDYYKLEDASYIINNSQMNKDKKRRLIGILQLIAESNGIDDFIELVSTGSVEGYSKLSTIEEYFRNYDKLGINLILLPDKYPKASLKNPLSMLEEYYSSSTKELSTISKPKIPNEFYSGSSKEWSTIPKPKVPKEFNALLDIDCNF